ncbi:MAG: undecaprenyl-diphosphate phosphatase [Clostridia bacterium]|nr:undecaprenyl-diphosphate phosphatase [Clostridia bacterium]
MYFLLLGIVQGLTEFLPVSSSGHLVILDKLFSIQTGNFLFVSIILHVATLVSVVIVFWKDIWMLIKHPFDKNTLQIILACLPTCIIVVLFKSFFESAYMGTYLGVCFMVTSIILMITYFVSQKQNVIYKQNGYTKSFIVGVVQGFAVLPGISRSGSTISAGVLLGLEPSKATNFSFVLSVPIILASLVYEIYSSIKMSAVVFTSNVLYLVLAFCVATICGVFAIRIMKKLAKTKKYYIFSIYLAILAIIVCFI